MPVVQVGDKRIEFPQGMSQSDIASAITGMQRAEMPRGVAPQYTLEPVATMASGFAGEALGGLAGLARTGGGMLFGENTDDAVNAGVSAVNNVKDFVTIQPQTQYGAMGMDHIGKLVEPLAEGIDKASNYLGNKAFDATGSPGAAAAAYTLPSAIPEILGLKALRAANPRIQFFDSAGNPTRELKAALHGMGLTWENLSPQAVAAIPDSPARSPITGAARSEQSLEPARVEQVRAGGSEGSLAPLRLTNEGFKPAASAVSSVSARGSC